MKKYLAILMLATLVAACEKESSQDLLIQNGSAAQQNKGGKEKISRPMKVELFSSEDPDPSIPPTACSGDLGIRNAGYFMHGNATHLGKLISSNSRGQDTKCSFSFVDGLLRTEVKGQLAAANGDLIYYTGIDVLDLNPLFVGGTEGTIAGRWTITGGTGRFTDASGYFDFKGPLYFAPPAYFSFTGEGVIIY
jgi:hypothetical protein